MKKLIKSITYVFVIIVLTIAFVQYGWMVLGFRLCDDPLFFQTDKIVITESAINILGKKNYDGSGYVGFIHKTEAGDMFIGLKFSKLASILEKTNLFDIKIHKDTSDINRIYFKNEERTVLIWEKDVID